MSEKREKVSNDALASRKRVVFTQGGKGGVGKTGFMIHLAEWFVVNQIPFTLLDLDTENKSRGSLKHYFNGLACLASEEDQHPYGGWPRHVHRLPFGGCSGD